MKSIFSRHGIPDELQSDNGPQFDSDAFEQFAKSYNIHHTTSSPYYPQGNALAERTVKTVKSLLEKAKDPYLALLNYRATPFPWCGLSPAQLLMGRQLRSSLPQMESHLNPNWSHLESFRQSDAKFREKQRENYDKRHRVHARRDLPDGTRVWVKTNKQITQGFVLAKASTPRSYWANTSAGTVRRNQKHLVPDTSASTAGTTTPDASFTITSPTTSEQTTHLLRSPIMTRSRTNTEIHPPDRLHY